ncbi:related to transposase [Sporisorium reilianum f. sp. reilianum]|uniref:Related to transposase n=1 Tax=Sporisorium reilianum f. sp. reilianum TaxID=72559 RepID=A0A2N8UDA8_9BASI|nr:related to transposase [Sporisorium reilianum f. sp. reilianum]
MAQKRHAPLIWKFSRQHSSQFSIVKSSLLHAIINLQPSQPTMVNISPCKKVARIQLKAERDQQDEKIQAPLATFHQGRFKNLKAAALHHQIPYLTLYHCKQGRQSHSEAFKSMQALPPAAEDVLVCHIHKQANFGFPVTLHKLKNLALQLLWQHTSNNDATLGKNWVAAFTQQHPELKSFYSRIMDAQRVLAGDPKVVEAYFDLLEETISKYNIIPNNIYNMDKTGFLLGQSQARNIIVPKENSKNR